MHPTLTLCTCFASNKLNNFSCLWFVCNHVGAFDLPYDKHVHLIFHMDDLCVATNVNNFPLRWLVCNHNDILSMSCHDCNGFYPFGVATNMLKTCSFMCFVCHHDDILDILHCVFLPNSSLIASRMMTTCSFQCLVCNNDHMVQDEIPPWPSHILMEFWCSHFLKMFH